MNDDDSWLLAGPVGLARGVKRRPTGSPLAATWSREEVPPGCSSAGLNGKCRRVELFLWCLPVLKYQLLVWVDTGSRSVEVFLKKYYLLHNILCNSNPF